MFTSRRTLLFLLTTSLYLPITGMTPSSEKIPTSTASTQTPRYYNAFETDTIEQTTQEENFLLNLSTQAFIKFFRADHDPDSFTDKEGKNFLMIAAETVDPELIALVLKGTDSDSRLFTSYSTAFEILDATQYLYDYRLSWARNALEKRHFNSRKKACFVLLEEAVARYKKKV